MSGEPRSAEFEGARVLAWVDEAARALRSSAWAPALGLHGADLLDLARSQISLDLLRALRPAAPVPPAPTRSLRGRLEREWRHRWLGLRTRRASVRPGPADVYFWPREPTHMGAHVRVARALERRGLRVAFVTSTRESFGLLASHGVSPTWTHAAWPDLPIRASLASARRSRALGVDPGVTLPELAGIANEDLVDALRGSLVGALPLLVEATETAARLARLAPRLVVIGNDLTAEGRAAQARLGSEHVPTATLSHGLAAGNPLFRYHRVDRVLVYGEATRRHLRAMGVSEERIAVVGAPLLDDPPVQTGVRRADIASALGSDVRRAFVLVALSGPGHTVSHAHHHATIEAIARCSAALPELDFVVKLHRKDDPAAYRAVAAATPGARLHLLPAGAEVTSDIGAWLQGAKALLTGASASAHDAMICDVPVITIDLAEELAWVDVVHSGAALHCTTASGLEAAVRSAVSDPGALRPQVAEYLRDTYGLLDGRSAERAADVLEQLMSSGKGATTAPGGGSGRLPTVR